MELAAIVGGVLVVAVLRRALGTWRRTSADPAVVALAWAGPALLVALAIVALAGGAWPATVAAAALAVVLTLDLRRAWRALAARVRSQGSAVTPFHNAT